MRQSVSRSLQTTPGTASYRPPSRLRGPSSTSLDDSGEREPEGSDDDEYIVISSRIKSLQETFSDLSVSYRFFGKSSGVSLVQTALDLKSEYNGTEAEEMSRRMVNRRPEFWVEHAVRLLLIITPPFAQPELNRPLTVGTSRVPFRRAELHLSST
jgi:hypothetical protein